ncbi:hypothetical protein [Dactylosporangium sp. NPDC000521]|uniref:hypothetical protein n=1 Tax=Dactylosporangium sp. NPDC000521 TaxID=3363975 RepID=UPI003693AD97
MRAVRDRFVIEVLKELVAILEDKTIASDAEAYAAFRRTVAILSVLAHEGRRR